MYSMVLKASPPSISASPSNEKRTEAPPLGASASPTVLHDQLELFHHTVDIDRCLEQA
jgi:hypothetical protein